MRPALRVLQVSANSPPQICGIGDYTFQLTNALKERGVDIATWSGTNADYTSPGWTALSVLRTYRKIDFSKFDLVHLQYEPFGFRQSFLLPFLLRNCGTKLIITFHEIFQRNWMQFKRDQLLAHCAASLIVNDAGSEAKLRGLLNGSKILIHRVGVGSNIPAIETAAEEIGTDTFRLGYFGFLNAVKRVDVLIESLAELHRLGFTKFRLRFIGDFQSSPREKSRLEELAVRLKVDPAIEWCVGLDSLQVAVAISECNLMILPFVDGATPRRGSFQACLKLGRPVATTLPTIADDELRLNDIVFPLEKLDVPNIVAVALAAEDNPDLALRLARAGKVLSERFSWTSIAAKHLEIYDV